MIATEHLQVWLPMQNSVQDFGKAGLNWQVQNGTTEFIEGKFGNTYKFESNNNYLSAGSNSNIANVTDEYTFSSWFYVPSGPDTGWFCLADFGIQGSSIDRDNNGFAVRFLRATNQIAVAIVHGEAFFNFSPFSGERPFWNTGIDTIPRDQWCWVGIRRTSNFAECIVYSTEYYAEAKIEKPLGSFNLWTNRFNAPRLWSIGAIATNVGQTNWRYSKEGELINNVMFWNKALSINDTKRLIHNFHPLNG